MINLVKVLKMKRVILLLGLVLGVFIANGQDKKDQNFNEETKLIEVTYYHENDVISQQGTFNLEGKLHGKWTSYSEEGTKIAEGSYNNGLKTGTWYFWSNDVVKEIEYDNNVIASIDGIKKTNRLVDKN